VHASTGNILDHDRVESTQSAEHGDDMAWLLPGSKAQAHRCTHLLEDAPADEFINILRATPPGAQRAMCLQMSAVWPGAAAFAWACDRADECTNEDMTRLCLSSFAAPKLPLVHTLRACHQLLELCIMSMGPGYRCFSAAISPGWRIKTRKLSLRKPACHEARFVVEFQA
jgi:hypothetical protein